MLYAEEPKIIAIDEYKSDIYYGNGIMTSQSEAFSTLRNTLEPAVLHDIYKDDANKMNRYHHFDVAYNYSFKEETVPGTSKD